MTRERIKFDGKFYKTMPWIVKGECTGCVFHMKQSQYMDCPNSRSEEDQFCDNGGEFEGKVFIEHGKEGLADYIAAKLEDKS